MGPTPTGPLTVRQLHEMSEHWYNRDIPLTVEIDGRKVELAFGWAGGLELRLLPMPIQAPEPEPKRSQVELLDAAMLAAEQGDKASDDGDAEAASAGYAEASELYYQAGRDFEASRYAHHAYEIDPRSAG